MDKVGNVFISWSGEESKAIADLIRNWLPLIIDGPDYWLSSSDLPEGKRWSKVIFESLEKSDFGILIITPQNVNSPWILFEAGAISKSLDSGTVIPYLTLIEKNELKGPLSQFQAACSDYEGTFSVVKAINKMLLIPINEKIIKERFDAFWSKYEKSLEQITDEIKKTIPEKTSQELEIKKLHEDLLETTSILKQIASNNYIVSSKMTKSNLEDEKDYMLLEGTWFNVDSQSHIYIKLINGILVAPYCYHGNNELTAEYYNWKKTGDYYFCQFRWFDREIRGFAFYKLINNDFFEGKWWYEKDLPEDHLLYNNFSEKFDFNNIEMDGNLGGVFSRWRRVKKDNPPKWAEEYFLKLKKSE